MSSNFTAKSTFCVINNPEFDIVYKHNEKGDFVLDDNGKPVILSKTPTEYNGFTPQQICDDVLNKWIGSGEDRSGCVLFCVSALGLHHLHCVFESKKTFRPLPTLKHLFPKIHIEITKGSKNQVEDYINKTGKFVEKGEEILAKSQIGDIIGCQGKRSDLISFNDIHDLIYVENLTPNEIFFKYPSALKSRNIVEQIFFNKRLADTPLLRDVHVTWYCGATGCGKTYNYVSLCEKHGVDNVYMVSDYSAPFDNYLGERIIFFDEFRGQIPLYVFLICLQGYRQQVHCRYFNKYALWDRVYISSPVTPYEVYTHSSSVVNLNDKLKQLYRRINDIIFCSKIETAANSYYFQSRYDCDVDGNADYLYKCFNYDLSAYKGFIDIGQAHQINDCVSVIKKGVD